MSYAFVHLTAENFREGDELWRLAGQSRAAEWRQQLAAGARAMIAYVGDGEYIGVGSLMFEKNDALLTRPSRRILLTQLFVKPAWRNQGIGGYLVDELCREAGVMGYAEVSTSVDVDNYAARHLLANKSFDTVLQVGDDPLGRYIKLLRVL